MATWADIASDGVESIVYDGTIATRPVFTVEFHGNANHFTVTHAESGKYIRIERPFQAGDVMVIDCDAENVTVNGVRAMDGVTLFSDFVTLAVGENNYDFVPVVAEVRVEYRKRYR